MTFTHRLCRATLVGASVLSCVAPATAIAAQPIEELVQKQAEMLSILDARVKELEGQVESLRRSQADTPAPVAQVAPATPSSGTAPAGADHAVSSVGGTISFRGGPEWVAANGSTSMKLRGRLLSEYWGSMSSEDGVDYPSGTLMRALRLGVEGRINHVLTYVAEADFGVGQTVLNDAYLQYKGNGPFFLRAGNIKPEFSLENLTGVHQTTFMERALPNTFAISDETLAISAGTSGKQWSFGATAFGDTPATENIGDEGFGFASRLTFAPVNADRRVLHVGASAMRRQFSEDALVDFRIQQRPESRLFSARLVNTGPLDAEDLTVVGGELSAVIGSWSFQTEYLRATTGLRDGTSADFDGGYAYASWFATGESRPYSASAGKFGRLKPNRGFGEGGPGAIEIALRYSTVNLTDGLIQGGEQDNYTLGLNWYFTAYSKMMLNWVHFDVAGSEATRPLGSASHEGNLLGLRVQADW